MTRPEKLTLYDADVEHGPYRDAHLVSRTGYTLVKLPHEASPPAVDDVLGLTVLAHDVESNDGVATEGPLRHQTMAVVFEGQVVGSYDGNSSTHRYYKAEAY
ncbi:hypothetical protein [Halomarina oriensis]|uniref:Uncharacterized protein n=1 Tax=Halomarina oriensis TaxID=671145 RepID=A0A6B0GS36_9EURY|nr:hypothetical protein [Halomarina oriensis]MWG36489.1 hypothetical protein [Halomarina oriensis]